MINGAYAEGTRSDEQLVLASSSDPDAFAEFYDRHAQRILAWLARRTLDPELAADLTAEAFAQSFGARSRFRDRGAGSAQAWIDTIARRQLSRTWRRQSVETRARHRLDMPIRNLTPEDYERIESLIDFEAVGRAVASALQDLSKHQRQAVTLRVIDGYSYDEVARRLGCSEEAARARVSRGLARLGTLLGP